MPKAYIELRVYTNDCLFSQQPQARVFAHLWEKVLTEHLNEFSYMARLAKLEFGSSVSTDCFTFEWSGMNDRMPTFVDEVLTRVLAMKDADLAKPFA